MLQELFYFPGEVEKVLLLSTYYVLSLLHII
jgi:hypothetical protein